VVLAAATISLVGLTGITPQAQAGRLHVNGPITFTRYDPDSGSSAIYSINPDGGHERQVVPFGELSRWSPTGTELALGGCADEGSCASTVVNPDTGSSRELPLPARFDNFPAVVWSPSGSRLAGEGVSDSDQAVNGIYSVRASDGGDLTRITRPPDGDDIPGTYSPDGHRLVFERNANTEADSEPVTLGIFVTNVNGHGTRRISPVGMLTNPEHGGAWSPRANQIVFDARPAEGDRFAIWLMHSDGSDLRRVPIPLGCGQPADDPTSVGCFAPGWSPDGRRIVFGTFTPATNARHIYSVRVDGSDLQQITSGTADDDLPNWGTHLASRR
jgi:Tol biopolymer transport system component